MRQRYVFLFALLSFVAGLFITGCGKVWVSLSAKSSRYVGELQITNPDQNGTKVSYLSESSIAVSGTCSEPGWNINISGDATATTTCLSGNTWSANLNFSSATDGTVSINVTQSSGSEASEPATTSFDKDTSYCAAHSSDSPYAGGSGTSADPYLICSTAQLMYLSNTSSDWGDDFQLRNDIDLTAQTWTPIGGSGNFDGDGFKIMNFSMTGAPDGSVSLGLFSGESLIENLGVVNADLVEAGNVSGVLCESSCTIENSYSTGTITATGYHVGGLEGHTYGPGISDSWSSVTLSGTAWTYGGIVGHNYGGTITGCYFTGSVSGTGQTGGLVGQNDAAGTNGTITDSYSTGSVTITSISSGTGGGLVGVNYCSGCMISDSFSTGAVSGVTGAILGGLDGQQGSGAGSTDSYWDITTSGQTTSPDGVGLTDMQMQQQTNFSGFDFTTPVWVWNSSLSNYPVLEWQ